MFVARNRREPRHLYSIPKSNPIQPCFPVLEANHIPLPCPNSKSHPTKSNPIRSQSVPFRYRAGQGRAGQGKAVYPTPIASLPSFPPHSLQLANPSSNPQLPVSRSQNPKIPKSRARKTDCLDTDPPISPVPGKQKPSRQRSNRKNQKHIP